jgi:hypothetical protein
MHHQHPSKRAHQQSVVANFDGNNNNTGYALPPAPITAPNEFGQQFAPGYAVNPLMLSSYGGRDMPTEMMLTDALFPLNIDNGGGQPMDPYAMLPQPVLNNHNNAGAYRRASASIPIRPRRNTGDTFDSSLASSMANTPISPGFPGGMDTWMMAKSFPGASGGGMNGLATYPEEDSYLPP